MDKYEYKLKLDQMKTLAGKKDYATAAEIADSINWHKVKNVNSLIKVGEIYEKTGRYEESRDVLLMAYDRSPIGKMIIYRLALVAIKMKQFEEAEEYYDEFVEMAPHDNLKYVIQYRMSKAKGEDIQTRIRILEELKEEEYSEEWAYELAYLYHKAGDADKCVETCDELILWFGEGTYVERALELKMLYKPLTKAQEEKYRRCKMHFTDAKELRPDSIAEDEDTVVIHKVEVKADPFSTQNLQEELAESMKQILEATKKEDVSDTMDNIKKMVEDIPYLKMPEEEPVTEQVMDTMDENQEIDEQLKSDFKELLEEDHDGQIHFQVPEKSVYEHQITGQMKIDEILEEWEKTRRAAQAALEKAEQQKLEAAKAKALQEAGDIMERLSDVIPKLDAGLSPAELLKQEYLSEDDELAGKIVADMNKILQEEIDKLQEEEAAVKSETVNEDVDESAILREIEGALERLTASEETNTVKIPEPQIQPKLQTQVSSLKKQQTKELPGVSMSFDEQIGLKPYIPEQFDQEEAEQKMTDESVTAEVVAKALEAQVEEMDGIGLDEVPGEEPVIAELSEEQKEIFSYFVPVDGMSRQLCQALTGASARLKKSTNSAAGNIIIQGGRGCGKTVLATSLIKALQKLVNRPSGKIGKIDANALNKKDVASLLKKVSGGCLIIERAGDIQRETAIRLSLLLETDTSGLLVILEDTRAGIARAMGIDEEFAKKFTEKINIPVFTSDELVAFGKAYANDLDYSIDEMGVLALYNRISNIQRLDHATTLTEVKDIIDEAIEKAEKGTLKKALSILTSRRYTTDDYVILREKDFEE